MTNRNCDTCKYKGTSLLTFPCTGCFSYLHRPYHKPYWIEKEPEVTKPPLGVMPKKLWVVGRIKDLCDAIGRAADHGTLDRPHVVDWINELRDRVVEVRQK